MESASTKTQTQRADAWMNRGLALLSAGSARSISESIACFEQAIALRRQIGPNEDPWLLFGLIGGHMNRADALTRLGGIGNLKEAAKSHATALTLLTALPAEAHFLFRERHAIAWLNHGVTRHALGTPTDLVESIGSFERTIQLVSAAAEHPPHWDLLLGRAWMNHGNALFAMDPDNTRLASISARQALQAVANLAASRAHAAEIDLTSRHLLCQTIAHQLTKESPSPEGNQRLQEDALHIVQEGLRLARHWRSRRGDALHPRARDLFRFGIGILQHRIRSRPELADLARESRSTGSIASPTFGESTPVDAKLTDLPPAEAMARFLLDTLDPGCPSNALAEDQEMHTEATLALWQTFRILQLDCLHSLGSLSYSQRVASLSPLVAAESSLLQLRSLHLSAESLAILGG